MVRTAMSRAEMGHSELEGGEAAFVMGPHAGPGPFVLNWLQEVSKCDAGLES